MALIYLVDMHLSETLSPHLSQHFNFGFLILPVHEWENYSDLFNWKLSSQIESSLLHIAWTSYDGGNEKSHVSHYMAPFCKKIQNLS